ncbi:TetR/AcrR family transcriptional regulator [Gordonia hydrophobica]|uniref:TetR/AcrR family transcriptional regulator n=1 Tax=Gordonia hydrophobica TaxID=40516 RepID=A0ABZ2U4Z0_9ACTN|nr:TetR/AcrR family transcriptional regulator [Gordonia hydrophobica]MBM7368159.1 AcrR family transcriptional regulator [Gordonia hydrophobica]
MSNRAPKRRLGVSKRRQQILDVTLQIVGDESFNAATPARIAREADIHRSLIYHQFGDMSGLFVALIERERRRAARSLAVCILPEVAGKRGGERLTAALAGAVRAVDSRPATWRLFLIPPEGAPPAYHRNLEAAQTVVRNRLHKALTDLGPSIVPSPDLAAQVLHAAGREILLYRLRHPESTAVAETMAALNAVVAQLSSSVVNTPRDNERRS